MARYKVRDIPYSLNFGTGGNTNGVTIENSASEVWNGTDSLTVFLRFKPLSRPTGTAYLLSIPATAGENRRYIRQSSTGIINVAVGSISTLSTNAVQKTGEWQSIALVTDVPNSRWRAYYNGVMVKDWTAVTYGTGTADITIGNNSSSSSFSASALISSVRIWNKVLTDNEIADIEFRSTAASSLVGEWLLSEGSGTTAIDTSGRGNNGVVLGATYTTDTQFRSRSASTRTSSVLYNGDFDTVPSVITAATNTASRWIDGTAAGSAAPKGLGWACTPGALTATAEAGYDTSIKRSGVASMRLSLGNATGTVTVGTYQTLNTQQVFPLSPNTAYRLVGYIRTNNVVTNGAFIDVRELSATLSTVATNSSTKVSGTDTSFRQVTATFTTGATTRFGAIFLRHNIPGNTADAWFDDITLTPATTGRVAVSSRFLA